MKKFDWNGKRGLRIPYAEAAKRIDNIDKKAAAEQHRRLEAQKRRAAQIDSILDTIENILTAPWSGNERKKPAAAHTKPVRRR